MKQDWNKVKKHTAMAYSNNLYQRFLKHMPVGEVMWVGVRPSKHQPVNELNEVHAIQGAGLQGDHRTKGNSNSLREITLICAEDIQLIRHYLKREQLSPQILRRNIVIRHFNLYAVKGQKICIGDTLIEITQTCPPCARMEKALGPGGFAAMMGHGGMCGKVLKSGKIQVGDPVKIHSPQIELDFD
ncbi:MAG: MOSC domain-containing protein [Pseudomonadales bacterium]|nr:MOSC domain-containing protein [Pseudomonadales bacterium]